MDMAESIRDLWAEVGEPTRYLPPGGAAVDLTARWDALAEFGAPEAIGRADRTRCWLLADDPALAGLTPTRGATVTRDPAGAAEAWTVDVVTRTAHLWALELVRNAR